jgi:hypothetical protein
MSDLIGFVYSKMEPSHAAADFLHRIKENCRGILNGGRDALVPIILDGENAWEYYHHNGRDFLRELYGRISADPGMEAVTVSEGLRRMAPERLDYIFPGSWINANFDVWIGAEEDNEAWTQLLRARSTYDAAANMPEDRKKMAFEELMIAEGSDWCWWYGDDHNSDHDREFDDLFRRHVRNIYRALGLPIPEDLFVTNITTLPPKVTLLPPTGPTAPLIDGRESSYFEWLGAGEVTPSATAGAMHQVAAVGQRIAGVRFGFGDDALCLQVATAEPLTDSLAEGGELTIAFLEPPGTRIAVNGAHRGGTVFRRTDDGTWLETPWRDLRAVVEAVAELKIPFERLGLREHAELAFVVTLRRSSRDVDESTLTVETTVPGRGTGRQSWRA